jgi:hypothetical protein
MESPDWRALIRHSAELRARSAQAREASAQLIAVSEQLAVWRAQRPEESPVSALTAMLGPVTGWDMHEDPATQVPWKQRLPAATTEPGNCDSP